MGEHKQFDLVVWALFGVGVLGVVAGIQPLVYAYRVYFGALLFGSFAVAAIVPLVLGASRSRTGTPCAARRAGSTTRRPSRRRTAC
jgi:hypothetical protein